MTSSDQNAPDEILLTTQNGSDWTYVPVACSPAR